MFSFFKKKSKIELLQEKYQSLLKEAYELSSTNRKKSDEKNYEADLILKEIKSLES
jgi:hypothetical protein